jgi:hypothetical protein
MKDAVVVRGKIWRSLDLANQSNVNSNISSNIHQMSTTTASNAHHNSLINANQTPHYQRHDFKNRRSSSEPANEQKMLAHIHSTSSTHSNIINNQNTTTTTNQITNTISSNNNSNNQTNSNSTNNSSLVIDDENPSDDFIDCLHQKNIPKVSKKSQIFTLTQNFIRFRRIFYWKLTKVAILSLFLSLSLSRSLSS